MPTLSCDAIKDAVLRHLADRTAAERVRDMCIVTLPIPTIDRRLVDVFIEPRQANYFLVHDGGKAANELILSGINITPAMHHRYAQLADRFGIMWSNEMFQLPCKTEKVSATALAVAMCSASASVDLIESAVEVLEDKIHDQVGSAVRRWSKGVHASVKEYFTADGKWSQHTFDFVAYPKNKPPIAISVLSPAGNPIASARSAAYRAMDLEGTPMGTWRKVAVETRSEMWTGPAKLLLAKCSDQVIEIPYGVKPTHALFADKLNLLLEAA